MVNKSLKFYLERENKLWLRNTSAHWHIQAWEQELELFTLDKNKINVKAEPVMSSSAYMFFPHQKVSLGGSDIGTIKSHNNTQKILSQNKTMFMLKKLLSVKQ